MFVIGVALALVFVIARWLGGGSDGSSDDAPAAEQAGARVEATGTVTAGKSDAATTDATSGATAAGTGATTRATPTLAQPDGPCDVADIAVTPSVPAPAEAGDDVTLRLSLQTNSAEACTWKVARSTVTVKISDGTDELWTTQQCPAVVPTESVVVRRAVATIVELTWNARESAAGCSRRTSWVLPGDYTIAAAALGGEPAEADFTLVKPTARTITPSAKATTKSTATPSGKPSKKPTKAVN